MKKEWLTKEKDMRLAYSVMEEYAKDKQIEALGLFELIVNEQEKRMDFRMANWVYTLAQEFNAIYDADEAEFVMRQVITSCMVQGQTLH